jgi:hypothetical protein
VVTNRIIPLPLQHYLINSSEDGQGGGLNLTGLQDLSGLKTVITITLCITISLKGFGYFFQQIDGTEYRVQVPSQDQWQIGQHERIVITLFSLHHTGQYQPIHYSI